MRTSGDLAILIAPAGSHLLRFEKDLLNVMETYRSQPELAIVDRNQKVYVFCGICMWLYYQESNRYMHYFHRKQNLWVRKIHWRRKRQPMDRGAWQATVQRVAKTQT